MMTDILTQVKETTDELIQILSSLTETELNMIPFEGSWTAAQVGEHLRKSYGVVDILEKPVKNTDRDPGEKINEIKQVMLNFDIKMQAPGFIVPAKTPIAKEGLLSSLQSTVDRIISTSQRLDLSQICLGFILPGSGEYTRLEWLHFILYHTQRHIRQVKNIRQIVTAKQELQN
ncbi:DinB family protein [Flavihumibacter sp. R14]|nr:DinB family protein [Flavihumibacter soli]